MHIAIAAKEGPASKKRRLRMLNRNDTQMSPIFSVTSTPRWGQHDYLDNTVDISDGRLPLSPSLKLEVDDISVHFGILLMSLSHGWKGVMGR